MTNSRKLASFPRSGAAICAQKLQWRDGDMIRTRRILWGLLYVLCVVCPIGFLGAEVVLALRWRSALHGADAFRSSHPAAGDFSDAGNARIESIWAIPWQTYRPGVELKLSSGDRQLAITINRHGFRTHEFATEKPAATIRIACVGGSTTFQGTTNEETYPALLEAKLRKKYPGVTIEVLNLGVSGLRSDYWLANPAALFRFKPDIVLQYEGVNDIAWRALPRYAMRHGWLKRARASRVMQALLPLDPRTLDREYAETLYNLQQMAALCRQHDAVHFAGSFAGPDYARATRVFKQYLDTNTATWTRDTYPISQYEEYARLLGRYNAILQHAIESGQLQGPLLHRQLTDPNWFVDLCHFDREGLERLADGFLAAASPTIEAIIRRAH